MTSHIAGPVMDAITGPGRVVASITGPTRTSCGVTDRYWVYIYTANSKKNKP